MEKPNLKPKWRFRMLGINSRKKEVTKDDLDKLEEAIWGDDEGKVEFLCICKRFQPSESVELSFDQWLKSMPVWKPKALRYCWFVLEWRPSLIGNTLMKPNRDRLQS